MEKLIKTGKKRKTSDKTTDLKKFFKEQKEKSQTFFSELMKKQMEEEKAEREKDRKLLMALFKMDSQK